MLKVRVTFEGYCASAPQSPINFTLKIHIFWEGHKICEISTVDLTGTTQDKSTLEILQNFVAFSEYMNFKMTYYFYSQNRFDWKCNQNVNLKINPSACKQIIETHCWITFASFDLVYINFMANDDRKKYFFSYKTSVAVIKVEYTDKNSLDKSW